MKRLFVLLYLFIFLLKSAAAQQSTPWLKISDNKRYFQTEDGKPFFWLGDTGWLLFVKCSREDVLKYLDARQQQGFNVVQVMTLHTLGAKTVYGDYALKDGDISQPITTAGNNFDDKTAYDFWDHVDFVIQEAAKRGIYMALVPVWGSAAKDEKVTASRAEQYAKFLAERFSKYSNIIWLNGGDIEGSARPEIWEALGTTIKKYDPKHLMTYHPRGRYSSTDWFHNKKWLDFNMFQSGHRTYAQDTSLKEKHRHGEDNWKYVITDYNMKPTKPVLDGEPSYENIPYGLHDSLQPRWKDADVRRYGYWSVFAGGAGYTYGENAIMQFNTMGDSDANFGVFNNWKQTINAPGALQMQYLKNLMLKYSYFDRKPAQEIIVDNSQKRYNYILATKGKDYAMAYTYTGRNFKVNTAKLGFKLSKAKWYSPVNGTEQSISLKAKTGIVSFNPPGEMKNGNDWVLVLEGERS
ncbi:glycoside hydrolase family 140 protein [Niabella ginsengisoli]|uniref:Glycoside hydrolase family 140 protein n=1 Tax=Niabella ginsengisoli TaxID=522298 RepID=A0ABS9SHI8_9BACT|nr:glycoside hydrolase family 140 protein [Niabella ginsengisoli]MCH5597790.1 glycoside hydrolase family 140 protein [Niabella ginsengisoli]